ncbi:class I SAM-dependent methyltransferase [Actinomadura rubrobrunea]
MERYGSGERVWSGEPNPQLVATAAGLPPGRGALDVGSGEGADSIWLASRGWKVTGVDVAQAALDRAARHADEAGVDVTAGRRHGLGTRTGAVRPGVGAVPATAPARARGADPPLGHGHAAASSTCGWPATPPPRPARSGRYR